MAAGQIKTDPIIGQVTAVSCGIYGGQPVLDLDYSEDSAAGVDGNFVMLGNDRLIEVQMSGEGSVFGRDELQSMLDLAAKGSAELSAAQGVAR